jgi:predicted transcriptional regulator
MGRQVGLSQIMQRVNLTTGQTKDYLVYLVDRGLIHREISERPSRCTYKTTPKGVLYFTMARNIADLFKPDYARGF